jgi:hypothetical protein
VAVKVTSDITVKGNFIETTIKYCKKRHFELVAGKWVYGLNEI